MSTTKIYQMCPYLLMNHHIYHLKNCNHWKWIGMDPWPDWLTDWQTNRNSHWHLLRGVGWYGTKGFDEIVLMKKVARETIGCCGDPSERHQTGSLNALNSLSLHIFCKLIIGWEFMNKTVFVDPGHHHFHCFIWKTFKRNWPCDYRAKIEAKIEF